MRFTKMHGIANDYIYVNGFEQQIEAPQALAPVMADRHTGIGGDGLILVLPAEEGVEADVRMRMFNADGSEARMCGNGIRCVCKFVHDRRITTAHPMKVQTAAGVLTLTYTTDDQGRVEQVTVDMGAPILDPSAIPVRIADLQRIVNHSIKSLVQWPDTCNPNWQKSCGLDHRMTCISMGNPHAIFYCENVAGVPLAIVGPALEKHAVFPQRINVHFVQVQQPNKVAMRTWERGSGITMACGSGAAAVCVAGVLTDRSDRTIIAHLPGGDLALTWCTNDEHVYMTGSATEVFTGDWPAA